MHDVINVRVFSKTWLKSEGEIVTTALKFVDSLSCACLRSEDVFACACSEDEGVLFALAMQIHN